MIRTSERDAAFFRPLWRRVAVVAILAVWTGVELVYGDRTWAIITGAILAYSLWAFFLNFPPEKAEK
ncbi:DUF3329 domain-containing protein [Aureimonas leprariae]|uniref:DUF3329 domain-containing protein n=1 Tax=Plantimonas leprariae TaxID=2615207 RepID=A0A7V7TWA8_9HYPH|nr:DUF3329 domain-containing protein [Aureimonas leprariae]KAB0679635.1 DUF3329 domain-containing protein [Aureimonas leprariae]